MNSVGSRNSTWQGWRQRQDIGNPQESEEILKALECHQVKKCEGSGDTQTVREWLSLTEEQISTGFLRKHPRTWWGASPATRPSPFLLVLQEAALSVPCSAWPALEPPLGSTTCWVGSAPTNNPAHWGNSLFSQVTPYDEKQGKLGWIETLVLQLKPGCGGHPPQ